MAQLPQSTPPHPLWKRLCKWYWKSQGFVWGTIIMGIITNLVANWLGAPASVNINGPLGWLRDHPVPLGAGIVILCLLTMLSKKIADEPDAISDPTRTTPGSYPMRWLPHLFG